MGSREVVAMPAPAAGTPEDSLRGAGWGSLIKQGLRRTKL
jgi:hypothetical protein